MRSKRWSAPVRSFRSGHEAERADLSVIIVALLVVALSEPLAPPVDARSVELLREECASRIATRDLVLFGNGTVRLREGPAGETRMTLGELGSPELEAYRRRRADVDFGAVEVMAVGPEGDWIEHCRLRLELDPEEPRELGYGRFDSGSLELEKLRRILSDLVEVARDDGRSAEIPARYEPRRGDLLERADGAVFEVLGFTSDGRGVELVSDDPPITMFVDRDQIRVEFRRLVAARRNL